MMPIRPEMAKRYPKDWKLRSRYCIGSTAPRIGVSGAAPKTTNLTLRQAVKLC